MKLKNLFLSLVAALFVVGSLSSCNSNSDNNDNMYVAIATIATLNDQGTVFTLRQTGDSPLITLTSSSKLAAGFKVGERVLIQFSTAPGMTSLASGPITLYGAARILGSGSTAVKATAESTDNWKTDSFEIKALIRTGSYIDMTFIASYGVTDDNFKLYLDESTIGTSCPEFHLILKPGATNNGQLGFYYASYSIADVWDNPNTDEVKIFHPQTGNLGTFTTLKKNETQQPIKPAE